MATYTTNLNLKKPATSDKIRIADFNNNADLIDAGYATQDTSLGKLGGGMAIISTGNVHAAISAGQFVYVRKHGTLAEGLYTADSNISANATLSTSNLTAVSDGGLNNVVQTKGYGLLNNLKLNNIGATSDTITFGGGIDSNWGSGNVGGIMFYHSNRKYVFRSKGAVNGYNEDYSLPVHSDDSSNQAYDILTTKDFPFKREIGVSPGGTTAGDGNNKITITSPGANRHCMLCFADQFTWIFCNGTTGTTVYSGTLPSGWSITRNGLTYTLTRNSTNAYRYTVLWI